MFIDHDKKFIFIHVYRTGGRSIEQALGGPNREFLMHEKLENIPNWENYFSFAFIRNPWDRTVSSYHYLTGMNKVNVSFPEYLRTTIWENRERKSFAQYQMVKNCSFTGRFEYLQKDFETVCDIIGIRPVQIPTFWHKSNRKPQDEYYNEGLNHIVKEANAGDIEFFGFNYIGAATKNIGIKNESICDNIRK